MAAKAQQEEQKFHLKVHSREGVVFDGVIDSMTSFNEKGEFDILARHANFISLIQNKIIIKDQQNIEQEIPIDNALLRMSGNELEVYVGIEGFKPVQPKVAPEIQASA